MRNRVWMISGFAAVAVLVAGCGSSGGSGGSSGGTPSASAPASSGASSATLKTASTSLGTVLTDGSGFTLYWFTPDTSSTSKCTGGCASTWPPVMGMPQAAAGASLPGTLGTITRPDGGTQATYAGHPLYRYALDSQPGMVKGDGVGGVWHAVKLSGGGAAPSPTQTSGGGGYGY